MEVPEGIRHGKFPVFIIKFSYFCNLFLDIFLIFFGFFNIFRIFYFLCALIANVTVNIDDHRDM